MIWRGGWDGKYDGAWEGQDTPLAPGFIRGAATIRVGASGTASAIGHLSGASTIAIGAAGTLGVPLPEGFIRGSATISINGTGRLTDPNAPQVFVLQGGSGDNSKHRRREKPRQRRRKLDQEIERVIKHQPPPARIGLTAAEVRQLIAEQVAATLQNEAFVTQPTLQIPRFVNQIVNRPPEQRIEPAGIAPEWFAIPAVVEDLTPVINAKRQREDEEALLVAAYHYFYQEAA